MAKKNPKNAYTYDFSRLHGTILEQFMQYLTERRKISDIIYFLSVMSDRLLELVPDEGPVLGGLEGVEDELYEFCNYFFDNFDFITYEARMREWGDDDAPIFAIAEAAYNERANKEIQDYLDGLSPFVLKETETLCDTLFEIRENRQLLFFYGDNVEMLEFPRTIPKEDLAASKKVLMVKCSYVIQQRGRVTVSLLKGDAEEMFGIQTTVMGVWSPIGADEMRRLCTTTENGIELEPEDNVRFTEIMREKF